MTFVPYLSAEEYESFGVSDATPSQIDSACRVINTCLARPEGLVWSPDANGAPAFMTNQNPSRNLTIPGPINPGSNVVIGLPGQAFGQQYIGEVVILDRAIPAKVEACVVTAASSDSITLASVQLVHGTQFTLDFGLTILQELPVPAQRSTVRLSRTPVVRILSAFGRYGAGRRSQQFSGPDINTNLLAMTAAFGGPPAWVQFPVDQTDVNTGTGEVWIPPGLMLAYFSDVRLRYVAGWPKESLPGDIKQAVANIVRTAIDSPFGGNIKSMKAGDAALERFSASSIDRDTQALLLPYKTLLTA
ncbi:hypothetical protein [Limnoglobus roseus]|uniref:Uncharacterized protein n=1 Tax=Limnoglobus roseus TaxID=2598579 RepID=A0A5C1AAD7_9BACT|nr:hypothetical protein [Limnoglobus roseus]QEL14782.1 hypothetical protein PX52LOC_01676 [Limnoglobus roseus]